MNISADITSRQDDKTSMRKQSKRLTECFLILHFKNCCMPASLFIKQYRWETYVEYNLPEPEILMCMIKRKQKHIEVRLKMKECVNVVS